MLETSSSPVHVVGGGGTVGHGTTKYSKLENEEADSPSRQYPDGRQQGILARSPSETMDPESPATLKTVSHQIGSELDEQAVSEAVDCHWCSFWCGGCVLAELLYDNPCLRCCAQAYPRMQAYKRLHKCHHQASTQSPNFLVLPFNNGKLYVSSKRENDYKDEITVLEQQGMCCPNWYTIDKVDYIEWMN
ncbi:hypothetical protein J437_LFUL013577 [Ladona fulva]|uniref:Uncharacterized protein n=1 Tax=Ladona fulva TaxID=123851 RepID=A0A8K0KCY3_LADFU|nr:hypothetical protein J437_LFUL013577 [Ladona fulva]